MRRLDTAIAIAMIAFSLAVLFAARSMPKGPTAHGLDPSLFPKLIAAAILVLSGLLLITSLKDKDGDGEPGGLAWNKLRLPLVLTIMTIAYAKLLDYVGFLSDTSVFLFAAMVTLGINFRTALLLSVGLTAIVYLVFRVLLHVPLPRGVLLGGIG